MAARMVNPGHDHGPVTGGALPPYGYLLIGASVAPPTGLPLVRPADRRRTVLGRLAGPLARIRQLDRVVRATGYRAVLIAPGHPPAFAPELRPPRFDVTLLVETDSPDALPDVASSPVLSEARDLLHASATDITELRARCVRAIADVDKRPDGLYLFNYWASPDRARAQEVWERLAPWFRAKTGLRNSTVLQSPAKDGFALINHARWDTSLPGFAAREFLRPSFHTYVRRTLKANDVEVYPALYRRI